MHATTRGVLRFGQFRQSLYVTVPLKSQKRRPNRSKRHRLNPGRRTVAVNRKRRAA